MNNEQNSGALPYKCCLRGLSSMRMVDVYRKISKGDNGGQSNLQLLERSRWEDAHVHISHEYAGWEFVGTLGEG